MQQAVTLYVLNLAIEQFVRTCRGSYGLLYEVHAMTGMSTARIHEETSRMDLLGRLIQINSPASEL